MVKGTYEQMCALSTGLRRTLGRAPGWTLELPGDLIARYLLAPILTAFVRELLGRLLPGPTAVWAHDVTDQQETARARRSDGDGLEEGHGALTMTVRRKHSAVCVMASWEQTEGPRTSQECRAGWNGLIMLAGFRPEVAADLQETYAFSVDHREFHVMVEGGTARAHGGPEPRASCQLTTDSGTLLELLTRSASFDETLTDGRARLGGRREALERCIKIFTVTDASGSLELDSSFRFSRRGSGPTTPNARKERHHN